MRAFVSSIFSVHGIFVEIIKGHWSIIRAEQEKNFIILVAWEFFSCIDSDFPVLVIFQWISKSKNCVMKFLFLHSNTLWELGTAY